MRKIHTTLTLLLVLMIFLASAFIMTPAKADLDEWHSQGWINGHEVNLTETAGVARVNEPVDIFFRPQGVDHCVNATKEIRVVAPDNSEVPSQVYNITMEGGYVKSCNIVFLANCSAFSSTTYYIIYNNTVAEARIYDEGLRFYFDETGDRYNVTAIKDGVEKNYFYLFWKNLIDLYSNGTRVTWAGGPPGWEFNQMSLGALWTDAGGTPWFGAGKSLSVLSSGPLFVDFNYTEAYASDLWGAVFDLNVTTITLIRVWYQQDLNPLVHYISSFHIYPVAPLVNYTMKTPYYLDFKLGNTTHRAIYKDFTWKNTAGMIKTAPVETNLTDNIWSPESPVGWWSYNGSRPDSTDKPAANIGLIPIYSGGTIAGADYTLSFTQLLDPYSTLPPQPLNHHCSQWFKGSFNGVAGDTIKTEGYIVVHTPVNQNVASIMEEKAKKLRTPLEYGVGPQFIIPEFPFIGALMILVLLSAIVGPRKLPAFKRLRLEA